jgi:hypothetical protein
MKFEPLQSVMARLAPLAAGCAVFWNTATAQAALWEDVTAATIGTTAQWTNKVELADINGDGWVDILFANGRGYASAGGGEANRVFLNPATDAPWAEATTTVMGELKDQTRAIKARDVNGDAIVDIFVANSFQTQSRLILGQSNGTFVDFTSSHLPQGGFSFGDAELGDVDDDGDLDIVLADWGAGNAQSNAGGRTRLWLNDGAGTFTDVTTTQMPDILVRFSWELELIDFDNDFDLDIAVSCKSCSGSLLFRNDGTGTFDEVSSGIPAFSNNYEFEAMHINGDAWLDLVTINDGPNLGEHVLFGNGEGFGDATSTWWTTPANVGADDNAAKFLDYDSDGDADFLVGSLSALDRLLVNTGTKLTLVNKGVFEPNNTPGTLDIGLADLDRDGRLDVVQAQGEVGNETDRVYRGVDLLPDTSVPRVDPAPAAPEFYASTPFVVRARIHDHKSPTMPHDWTSVAVEWAPSGDNPQTQPMQWYGEYLWRAALPISGDSESITYRFCATDAAGNTTCSETFSANNAAQPPADASEPDTTEPDAGEDTAGPDSSDPDSSDPDSSDPDSGALDVGEPDSDEQDVGADTAGPDSAEPDSAEPDAGDDAGTTPNDDTDEPDVAGDVGGGGDDASAPDSGSASDSASGADVAPSPSRGDGGCAGVAPGPLSGAWLGLAVLAALRVRRRAAGGAQFMGS